MIYGQESAKLEFKREIPKNSQITKTVIAFSNAKGGKLVIGVGDDGTVCGISETDAHAAMESLDAAIYEACTPPIIPLVYLQRLDDKVLLIIEVSAGSNKPYYQKSLGLEKGVYIRLGRSTMSANADIIEELKWQSRGISYDQLPVYHSTQDALKIEEIERFFSHRRNGAKARATRDMLISYELIKEEHNHEYPSVGGILLFGYQPQKYLTEAYVLCTHFSGIEGREAIASRAINGTLFEQFDAAFDFIAERLNRSYQIREKKRQEQYEVPLVAIREALMNAILHRNYHINAPIKIAIFSDRIEIFSPGGFPGPIDGTNLESGITYVRNPVLAKILWETQYVEKMGSGFITIFRSYREAKLKEPVVIEGVNFVKCILPRLVETEYTASHKEEILGLFHSGQRISRSDVVTLLHIPKTTAGRLLASMEKDKIIQRVGKGRSTTYERVVS